MLEFYSICSGSKGNCFVIKSPTGNIVIDCGGTKAQIINGLKQLDINIEEILAVLITHNHSDHTSQLKLFENIEKYSACNIGYYSYQLKPYVEIKINDFHIIPIPLSHDAENTLGYIVSYQQESLVYITDTGYLKEQYIDLIKNANHYVIEFNHDVEMLMNTKRPYFLKRRIISDLGHLCNEDAAIIVNKIIGDKTKTLWLAHLSTEANTPELAINKLFEIVDSKLLKDIDIKTLKQNEIVGKDL